MQKQPAQGDLFAQLCQIESTILRLENDYLEQMTNYENKFKDHSAPNRHVLKKKTKDKLKKPSINDKDRLFSLSSCTSEANIFLKKEIEQGHRGQKNGTEQLELAKRNKSVDIPEKSSDDLGRKRRIYALDIGKNCTHLPASYKKVQKEVGTARAFKEISLKAGKDGNWLRSRKTAHKR